MIDVVDLIYFALGLVVGASALFVFLAREPADYPACRREDKRQRIAPESKVAPMHVLERVGRREEPKP